MFPIIYASWHVTNYNKDFGLYKAGPESRLEILDSVHKGNDGIEPGCRENHFTALDFDSKNKDKIYPKKVHNKKLFIDWNRLLCLYDLVKLYRG